MTVHVNVLGLNLQGPWGKHERQRSSSDQPPQLWETGAWWWVRRLQSSETPQWSEFSSSGSWSHQNAQNWNRALCQKQEDEHESHSTISKLKITPHVLWWHLYPSSKDTILDVCSKKLMVIKFISLLRLLFYYKRHFVHSLCVRKTKYCTWKKPHSNKRAKKMLPAEVQSQTSWLVCLTSAESPEWWGSV